MKQVKRRDGISGMLTFLDVVMAFAIVLLIIFGGLHHLGYTNMQEDSDSIYASVIEEDDATTDTDELSEMIAQMFEEAGYSDVSVTVTESDDGYEVATTVEKYLQTFSSSATVTYTDSTES